MSFNVNKLFQTTTARNITRGAVSSVVGAVVAWGTTRLASLNTSSLSYLVPAFSSAYFALVHMLEAKYPRLGWLLGVLPHKDTLAPVVQPTPAPAPVPAPEPVPAPALKENDPVAKTAPAKKAAASKVPAKKNTPAKKATPKKN